MQHLLIAWRNLVRNARRSVATLLGIGIGAVAILLFGGYKANISYAMQTAYVRLGGHLQIQHKDFFLYGSGNPTAYGISNATDIINAIRNDPVIGPRVEVVTPTLQFGGIAGNYAAGVSRTIIGSGINAVEHAQMRLWNAYALELHLPPFQLKGSSADAAIIGSSLARVLQLCDALAIPDCERPDGNAAPSGAEIPDDLAALSLQETTPANAAKPQAGSKIELLASNPRGAPNVVALNVIAAESQGFKEFDEVYVLMHLDQAQRLIYGSGPPKVTSILIQLKDSGNVAAVQQRIESKLQNWGGSQKLVVRDFGFLNPFYVQSINMFDTIFGFVFILIGGIVMFTVSNTMNTTVIERTVEVGTLRAIGLRQAGVRRMFVTEGFMLGLAGAVLGLIASLAAAVLVNHLDLQWLPPGSATPVPLALSVWGEVGLMVGTSCFLVVMATASAWWPAYRAARLSVVDALRHA